MPKVILGTPVDEKKWTRAKTLAAEQGHGEDWDYIVGIYKKLAHLEKSFFNIPIKKAYTKKKMRLAMARCGYFTTEVRCANCNALLYRLRTLNKSTEPLIEIKCRRCGTFNII